MRSSALAMLTAIGAALLLLLVGGSAQADHQGGNEFKFMLAIDEDSDGHAENFALDDIYKRDLTGLVPTLDAAAGWVDGDRQGYTCAYAFLKYRDTIVGRVTVRKFKDPVDPRNAYIELQDKFMHEGALNFDGTVPTEDVTSGGGEAAADDGLSCDTGDVGPGGAAKEGYEPLTGEPEFPVITYQHGPHAIEVRDFADPEDFDVEDSTIVYDLVSATPTQVIVLAYQDNGDLPLASIYYELVGDPQKGVAVGDLTPGTKHPVTMHVDCGHECHGMPHHEPAPGHAPELGHAPEPSVGDLNGDGRVDAVDIRILMANWTG